MDSCVLLEVPAQYQISNLKCNKKQRKIETLWVTDFSEDSVGKVPLAVLLSTTALRSSLNGVL